MVRKTTMEHKFLLLFTLILLLMVEIKLVSGLPKGLPFSCVIRTKVYPNITYTPERIETGDRVRITLELRDAKTGEKIEGRRLPRPAVLHFFGEYKEYDGKKLNVGDSTVIQAKKTPIYISIDYSGNLPRRGERNCNRLYFEGGRVSVTIPVIYVGALRWLMDHYIPILTVFFVITAYHWFTSRRMDFEALLHETHIPQTLKELLSKK